MAVESKLLGPQVSQTLYSLDVARRFVNVGGVLNRAVDEDRLVDWLQTTDASERPYRHAALQGGLTARRCTAWPMRLAGVAVGTGQHRLMPGEPVQNDVLLPPALRWSWLNTSAAGADVMPHIPMVSSHPTHPERLEYLSNRFKQSVDNFGDMGLLGLAALWAAAPVYAVSASVGVTLGWVVGTGSYGVMRICDHRPGNYSDFVSAFTERTGALAATVMFGAMTTAPAWLALQVPRASVAAVNALVTAVGAGAGVGCELAVRGWQQRSVAASKLGAAWSFVAKLPRAAYKGLRVFLRKLRDESVEAAKRREAKATPETAPEPTPEPTPEQAASDASSSAE